MLEEMWGGFDFGLKEALERAKQDLEKSVDSALGIEEAEKREQEQKLAGRQSWFQWQSCCRTAQWAHSADRQTATLSNAHTASHSLRSGWAFSE